MTGTIGQYFVLLGCCFICEREKMIALGGFDEIYSPYYWEDADLALRTLESGYSLKYSPECVVYHLISSTISKTRTKWHWQLVSYRNKILFSWRYLAGLQQWTYVVEYCNSLVDSGLEILRCHGMGNIKKIRHVRPIKPAQLRNT